MPRAIQRIFNQKLCQKPKDKTVDSTAIEDIMLKTNELYEVKSMLVTDVEDQMCR